MDKTKIMGSEIQLPRLRTLDDFLLGSARFQIPNFKDLEKWGHRVVNNLLYYQANYFLMTIVIFLIVGYIHPLKMLVGMLGMIAVLSVFVYVSSEERALQRFKKQYPIAGIGFIILAGSFVTYTLGSLLVFMLVILMSFSVTFIHASLRLRCMKNKIVNKIEGMGFARTPMGVLLGYFVFSFIALVYYSLKDYLTLLMPNSDTSSRED